MPLLAQLVDHGEVYLYGGDTLLSAMHREDFCRALMAHLSRDQVDVCACPLTPITCGAFFAIAKSSEFARVFPDLEWGDDSQIAAHLATIFCGILRMDPVNLRQGTSDLSLYCLHAAFFAQFYALNKPRFMAVFTGSSYAMFSQVLGLINQSSGSPASLDAYQKAAFYMLLEAAGQLDHLTSLYIGSPVQQFLVRFEAKQIVLLDRFLHPGSRYSASLNPAIGSCCAKESQKHLIISGYKRYKDIGHLQASVAEAIQKKPCASMHYIQKHPGLRVLLELLAYYPGKVGYSWFSSRDGASAISIITHCCNQASS